MNEASQRGPTALARSWVLIFLKWSQPLLSAIFRLSLWDPGHIVLLLLLVLKISYIT